MPKRKLLKFDAEKYAELKTWQQNAFDLLINKDVQGLTVKDVAEKIGKSRVAVSQFYNSECYANVARIWAQQKYKDKYAPALNAVSDILKSKNEKVQSARARVALKILEEPTAPEPVHGPAGGDTNNIMNIFFGDPRNLNLENVRKAKAELLKRIGGEVEQAAEG